jgi:hypothetical protein
MRRERIFQALMFSWLAISAVLVWPGFDPIGMWWVVLTLPVVLLSAFFISRDVN